MRRPRLRSRRRGGIEPTMTWPTCAAWLRDWAASDNSMLVAVDALTQVLAGRHRRAGAVAEKFVPFFKKARIATDAGRAMRGHSAPGAAEPLEERRVRVLLRRARREGRYPLQLRGHPGDELERPRCAAIAAAGFEATLRKSPRRGRPGAGAGQATCN